MMDRRWWWLFIIPVLALVAYVAVALIAPGLERENRQVVSFGTACSEHDFVSARTDELPNRSSRAGERVFGPSAQPMNARRVSEVLTQKRQHRLEHLRSKWRGRVVVQIYVDVF